MFLPRRHKNQPSCTQRSQADPHSQTTQQFDSSRSEGRTLKVFKSVTVDKTIPVWVFNPDATLKVFIRIKNRQCDFYFTMISLGVSMYCYPEQWPVICFTHHNLTPCTVIREHVCETNLRRAFSSGLKCVSLCLFRTGGPAEELESESDDAWLVADGRTTEIGRLKPPCEPPEEPVCFPDIKRTLWAPPAPAVTTTMFCRMSWWRRLLSEITGYPHKPKF